MTADDTKHTTALVVDDDADQRLVVRHALLEAGVAEVVEAPDAEAAMVVAAERVPDLIVLDIAMPGRSGLELLPDLHSVAPGVPVVVLSSFPRARLADSALRRGAVGYVEKRVPRAQLANEILLAAALADQASGVVSASFPSDPAAASGARRFVRNHFSDSEEEVLSTVELLVTELVTNAVRHASSAPRVDIQLNGRAARVEVHDDDPRPPQLRHPGNDSIGGRGLLLIERLATRWGVEARSGGKSVWFELDRA